MATVVLVTGGFDPLHSGHIAYLKAAKAMGDELWVGLNSDDWLTRKKGQPFMPVTERISVLEVLNCVDKVLTFDDTDGSACDAIAQTLAATDETTTIIFANGGDRTWKNIPEMNKFFGKARLEFEFGVGGDDKKNSSSWILKQWEKPVTKRAWGSYTVLDKNGAWQVKELQFDVGKALSDQRHFKRSEHWHVVKGSIKMDLEYPNGDKSSKTYTSGDSIDIPVLTWHKAYNVGKEIANVVEVWMGEELTEDDIERRD